MPDQLLLDLGPAVPRLPSTIRPMLPRPEAEPFDSSDHLFEPSWGGHRTLAFIEPDPATGALAVRLQDADGRDVTALFPELAGLAGAVAAPFVVLDGEVIVPDGLGRADRRTLQRRLLGERGPAASGVSPGAATAAAAAAVYLAFDLLYSEGRPLVALPLTRRRQILGTLVTPTAELLVVPAVAGDGRALFEAAIAQQLPGILARHARGPYLAGRRSGLWRSISTRARPRPAPVRPGASDTTSPDEPSTTGPSRPLLALIRRLPLPFGED